MTPGHGSSDQTLAIVVVSAVAEREQVPAHELPPLYDSVDPDALEALFRHSPRDDSLAVSFAYAGYEVTVRSGWQVTLDDLPASNASAAGVAESGSDTSATGE